MKKKRVLTWIVMVVLAAGIIVGYIYALKKKNEEKVEPKVEKTEVELLLEKDIINSYPVTPREVVKLYSRYTKCFYNEDLKEEDLEKMAEQIRLLFDEELLQLNPMEEYLTSLQADILLHQTNKRKLLSYEIEKSSGVIEWTKEGADYAKLIASYTMKETQIYKVHEEFVLRRDEEDRWKILGWRLDDGQDMEKD